MRILAHRSEMGTGIRTSLPMVVADEMGANWERVEIEQAIGDARLGSQNTDGSRSIRRFYQRMRVVGATARTMLEQAAAQTWGVEADECRATNHEVVHQESGKKLGFGALVEKAKTLEVPAADTLKLRAPEEFRYIGKEMPVTDGHAIVTGTATFGIDARRDGQLFAVIARPPVVGATLESVDSTRAKKVAGVVDVITMPTSRAPHGFQALGGVAVVANDTYSAMQGREALELKWNRGPNAKFDSAKFEKSLTETVQKPGLSWRAVGDVDQAFTDADAKQIHDATYYVPLLAHASMEPPCALAEMTLDASGKPTKCEVWAPTQNPQAAQAQLASTFSIDPKNAVVHVTLLGGGFGRKSKPDYVVEAAWLAKETKKPVLVQWTREDDIRHDYYHSCAAVHMKAALGKDGAPTAWLQRTAFPTIGSTFNSAARSPGSFELALGFTDIPYDVPNLRVESRPAESHVRIGWLRSVAHIQHAFAVCSFPDELAHAAGQDPYEYWKKLLGESRKLDLTGVDYGNHGEPLDRYPFDVGRLRNVLDRVAKISGWGRKLPKGRGLGIACHRSFLSYCANVVEVQVEKDGTLTIPKVHVVIDPGQAIHPDRVISQMEGAAIFGTSLALHGEITATDGEIDQSNFHDYPLARIHESPKEVEVDILESGDLPGGVGEVGVPPFAPALCNAIFAATGKRIRRLPLVNHDLSWS
ncbi:MAG: molybdopterin cofactor-binding domain-containing protein [Planctomycetota bacterium]